MANFAYQSEHEVKVLDAGRYTFVRLHIGSLFFLFSVMQSNINVRTPDLQVMLHLSDFMLGVVLTGAPLGSILISLVASRTVETFGTRRTILVTYFLMAVAGIAIGASRNLYQLFIAFALFGAMSSLGNIAINVEADRVELSTRRRLINRCHGFWSVGYLTFSFLAGLIRSYGLAPLVHLTGVAVLFVAVTSLMVLWMVECRRRPYEPAASVRRLTWPSEAIIALIIIGVGAELLEGAARIWSIVYLRDVFDASLLLQSFVLPAFISAAAVGRLQADKLIDRYGPRLVGNVSLSIAAFGLLAVALSPNAYFGLTGFAVAGLGSGVIYPLMLSQAARLSEGSPSGNVVTVTVAVQTIILWAPAAIGTLAQRSSVRFAFAALLPIILLGLLMSNRQKTRESR